MKKIIILNIFILLIFFRLESQDFGNAISFGDWQSDDLTFVETNSVGNILVVGSFEYTVDFDPGPDVIEFTYVENTADIYLAMYNQNLELEWVEVIVATNSFELNQLVLDENDNIYLLGSAEGVVSVDSGFGNQVSGDDIFAFLVKYDANGNYQWMNGIDDQTTEESYADYRRLNFKNDGSLELLSLLQGEVDVDPDFFVTELYDAGSQSWVISNYAAIDGDFLSINDSQFGIPEHLSKMPNGNFLSATLGWTGLNIYVHDPDGTSLFGGILGGSFDSFSRVIDMEFDTDENIYVLGHFSDILDFDLGIGENSLTPTLSDIFLVKYTSELELIWAKHITGTSNLNPRDLEVHSNEVYITGSFYENIDLDPSSEILEYNIPDVHSGFVSKFDSNGNLIWGHVMTGTYGSLPSGLGVAPEGTISIGGNFSSEMDPYDGVTLIGEGDLDCFVFTIEQCFSTYGDENYSNCGPITINDETYNKSGVYEQYLINNLGCDSVLSLQVTIDNPIDLSIEWADGQLQTSDLTENYQWIDCDDNNNLIAGEIESTFIPDISGSYALTGYNGACSDTSACESIVIVSIPEELDYLDGIEIFPNPSNGPLQIQWRNGEKIKSIEIYNELGQKVYGDSSSFSSPYVLDNLGLKGIYFLKIEFENFGLVSKVLFIS